MCSLPSINQTWHQPINWLTNHRKNSCLLFLLLVFCFVCFTFETALTSFTVWFFFLCVCREFDIFIKKWLPNMHQYLNSHQYVKTKQSVSMKNLTPLWLSSEVPPNLAPFLILVWKLQSVSVKNLTPLWLSSGVSPCLALVLTLVWKLQSVSQSISQPPDKSYAFS